MKNIVPRYKWKILSHLNHAGFGIEPWQPVHWSERRVERVFLLLWKIFLLLLWKIFLLLWKIFLLDSLPTYTFGSSRLGVSVVHIQIQGYLLIRFPNLYCWNFIRSVGEPGFLLRFKLKSYLFFFIFLLLAGSRACRFCLDVEHPAFLSKIHVQVKVWFMKVKAY